MKSIVVLGAAMSTACVMPLEASAYQLSPPKIRSVLSGQLTFTPTTGGQPSICNVHMSLRTRGSRTKNGYVKPSEIENVFIEKQNGTCANILFIQALPWKVNVISVNGGEIFGGGWRLGGDGCSGTIVPYVDDANGNFTLGPGCLSGTLSSSPPVRIVP